MYARPDLLLKAVFAITGISLSDLSSDGRHPSVVFARRLAVASARKHTRMSYPEITAMLGKPGRGHAGTRGMHASALANLESLPPCRVAWRFQGKTLGQLVEEVGKLAGV